MAIAFRTSSSSTRKPAAARWLLFKNTGSGFASTGTPWAIPYPANVLSSGYHAVLDLDGDRHLDFVQYDKEASSTDASIGVSDWKVFAGQCP